MIAIDKDLGFNRIETTIYYEDNIFGKDNDSIHCIKTYENDKLRCLNGKPSTVYYWRSGKTKKEIWMNDVHQYRYGDNPTMIKYDVNGSKEYEEYTDHNGFQRFGNPARIWYKDNKRIIIEYWEYNNRIDLIEAERKRKLRIRTTLLKQIKDGENRK